MEVIEIMNSAERVVTGKSMEYDAKSFIRIAKTHMEAWEKSLERGKQGKPCNFKSVLKQIEKIRKDIIDDKDGVLGNKHVLFIDIDRYSKLIDSDFYNLEDVIQQYMVKQFSSGLAREEAFKKVKDKVDDYNDELDAIRADKKDYRLSFLLEEFEDLIDKIKDMVDPDKSSKSKNIHRILGEFSSILENTGIQVDITDDPEKKKMYMKHYTYSKELVHKFIGATKNTAGHMYGAIVTKVMSE